MWLYGTSSASSLKGVGALHKFAKGCVIFKFESVALIDPHIQPRNKHNVQCDVHSVRESLQSPERSNKGSKSNAAIANIPCGINVPEEDISENPESYIMVKSALLRRKAVIQLTGQIWA